MEIQQHDGVVVEVAGSRQGFAKLSEKERCHGREREAPGLGFDAPMCLPTIYRGGGGWFLALQVHWGVDKGGGKKSHHFPSPPIVIPLFLGILILSLRDMILFLLRGILVCLDQGCGALPPLPTFMLVPPCKWAPLRNLLEPSWYNTEKSQTFSGGQNRTSHI